MTSIFEMGIYKRLLVEIAILTTVVFIATNQGYQRPPMVCRDFTISDASVNWTKRAPCRRNGHAQDARGSLAFCVVDFPMRAQP